jgi:hypothetical protein
VGGLAQPPLEAYAEGDIPGDDDVLEPVKPVVERPGLRIYLVDGSDHCLSLTSDPQGAAGLLLAEVEPGG